MSALTDLFSSMANKIRSKTGTATTYTPPQMVSDGIDDVYDAGVAAATTPITPSDSSPVAMSANTGYKPTRGGYAIESQPINVVPLNFNAGVLTSGSIYKPTTNGYAVEDNPIVMIPSDSNPFTLADGGLYVAADNGYAIENQPTSVTPSDSTPVSLSNGTIYRAGGNGYAIESQPTSITPSDSSPVSLSSGGIYKPSESGYAIKNKPSTKTPSNTTPPSVSNSEIIRVSGSAGYLYATKPTLKKTTLWTNPSPTADFSSQTVTLSSGRSNFDYIGVEYKNSKSGSRYMTAYMSRSDLETTDNQLGLSAYTSAFYNRSVYVSSSTLNAEIIIGHCYKLNATGTQNGYCTPYKVYGCKIQ